MHVQQQTCFHSLSRMSQMLATLAVSLCCFNSLFKAAVPVATSLRDLGLMETFSL